MVLAPLVRGRKGEHQKILENMRKAGYVRVRVDGEVRTLEEDIVLDKKKKHDIAVVIDRLAVRKGITQRLADSVETALGLAEGLVEIEVIGGSTLMFSEHFACSDCDINLPEIEPRLFSFNNPYGACPACMGLGSSLEADFKRILPDETMSFRLGAIQPFPYNKDNWLYRMLDAFLKSYDLTMDSCFQDLPEKANRNA